MGYKELKLICSLSVQQETRTHDDVDAWNAPELILLNYQQSVLLAVCTGAHACPNHFKMNLEPWAAWQSASVFIRWDTAYRGSYQQQLGSNLVVLVWIQLCSNLCHLFVCGK